MENNSKSGLKMTQIIATALVIVVLSSNVQLFISTKEEGKIGKENKQEQNVIKQEVVVAEKYERNIEVTARSSAKREQKVEQEVVKQEEVKYKTIEEIEISKNMDLSLRCGISKEDFKELMKNLKTDTSGFFYENSEMIYDLCEKYELNEVFFCGLIAAESGWNITKGHRNKCNYISMMSKGKMIRYNSVEEGLEAAAKLLHNKYLTPGGAYYKGKTLKDVQKIFCPNSSTWVGLVYGCMDKIV